MQHALLIATSLWEYLSSLKTRRISQIFLGQKCNLPQKSPNNTTFEAKPGLREREAELWVNWCLDIAQRARGFDNFPKKRNYDTLADCFTGEDF
jgi:hypothetical protein